MKRSSVVVKLFAVTSVSILVVFSLIIAAQGLFFEQFYRSFKIQGLERDIHEIALKMDETGAEERRTVQLLGQFMNEKDASIAVLDDHFDRLPIHPYFLEIQTNSKVIRILLPEAMSLEDIPQGMTVGDKLVVDGIFMDEKDTIMQPVDIQPTQSVSGEGLVRVSGEIKDLLLPAKRSYNPLYQDMQVDEALLAWRQAAEFDDGLLRNDETAQTAWTDQWSGIEYAILIRPLGESQPEQYLLVMASMQPVGEAVGVLKQYYIYLAPVIVCLVLLLSLLYSRMVARPLVQLNRNVKNLAQLDFSASAEIRTKDEFGELSRNMMTMSMNLEQALRELTHANARLEEDMEEKQRSEQLRKELIANISHELKTPLGIVKGYAEGLQDDVAEEKRERYLAFIVNETNRMNDLIMDMLELSKYEVNAVRLQTRTFLLSEMIQQTADSFVQQLEHKGLRVSLSYGSAEAVSVQADSKRMEQVIRNLLSNAVRHAEENSVITIRTLQMSPAKVTTFIENVGTPIARQDLHRIWDQFYRVERSRDRKSGGTGLGLAIVKHILELHGSEFGVMNTEQGVAFYFTLNESGGDYDEKL
ncbi:HAMP domain-containing sensor histidine kinase [Paenibacillus sp. JCM 10914]|uniref:sensor histidine kinase n=1 Tax=Paenibacillus sp. JCM 10914 TaxID=1236974 RepID=UPI0003CC5CB9|nr:sensor histidine kinase [Paenibacillus sp. JCM 10914]GAE06522.1 sensor histidine kinase [Paenibacillus sp. JCM 10914]